MTKRPKTIPEAKFLMWEVHQRMPAWKADKLIEFYKTDQADLAVLGEATGIQFESKEMLSEAVQCLERIRNEKDGKDDANVGVPKASDPHSSQSDEQELSDEKGSDDSNEEKEPPGAPEDAASKTPDAADDTDGTNEQHQKSSSKEPEDTDQQQDASASSSDPVAYCNRQCPSDSI